MFVSLNKLCYSLHSTPRELRELAETAGRYYIEFPKLVNGKIRQIKHSTGRLKEIQQQIYRVYLKRYDHPYYLHCVPGRSIQTNARPHVGQSAVVSVDVKNFFPSISHRMVFNVWRFLDFSPSLSRILTQLTTFERELPLGNPPSTAIANIVLRPVDEVVMNLKEEHIFQYSRYSDDITVSGENAHLLIQPIVKSIQSAGLKVGRKKTKVQRPHHGPQIVTGLVVNNSRQPTLIKGARSKIRQDIKFMDQTDSRSFLSLRSRILRVKKTNPGDYKRLVKYAQKTAPGMAWPPLANF